MPRIPTRLDGVPIPVILIALALGLAGGMVAGWLGLPLPLLLGGLVTLGLVSLFRLRPFGQAPRIPESLRGAMIPIIGVSIGSALTPDVLGEVVRWLPSLALMVLYVPLAHAMSFAVYRMLGRLDRPTSYFSAMPGGLLEALDMGERAGANVQMLTLLQFLRLIMCIVLVPMGFAFLLGSPVGSAAGVVMTGSELPFGWTDAVLLVGAAIFGVILGNRLRLPAAALTGPLLLSGLIHVTGLTQVPPPFWVIAIAQLVLGIGLGTRFDGMPRALLPRALALAGVSVALTLGLAVGAAILLAATVGQTKEALILSFAPGGVSEMSLVAISLQIGVVYVATHHILRILLAVAVAQLFARRFGGVDPGR